MKNITRIVLTLILTAGIATSCKDYLNVNPVSSFGPDYVFGDQDNALKAVLGAYSALGGDAGYGIRISMYYPYDNDEMMGQGGTPYPDNERRDIAHYNVQPSNTQLANPFNQLYTGIERANICIYYIPRMAAYSNGSADEQANLKRLHGEALTLRAQYYYELIRNWGDVPAQFLPSSFETDLFKGRTDRDVIYDQILTDLDDAAKLVPWRSKATNDERITQGAVRGLRARIALARGGYSLRNTSNTMQRSSDYKKYYQIARDEANAIIQSGEHKLNPSFKSVFKDAITAHVMEPNGEVIWEVACVGGSSATGDSKLAYYNGPRVNGNGNGALTVLPTYFYLFEKTDTRRDVMCAPYDVNLNGTLAPRTMVTMVDGKFRRDWITNPVPSPTSAQQYFALNWPMIRYSDVLLMFAEAENELNNGPTPAAITAFETVRKRAFGGSLGGGANVTPSDYNGFFNAVVIERSLELGGEGIRKYDLIRWNLLTTKINETKATLANMALPTSQATGSYTVGTLPATQQAINTLPTTVYYVNNSTTLTLAGTSNYYSSAPVTPPANSTAVTWSASTTVNTTLLAFYAISFTPNKSELLPFATSVVDANPNLQQNFGF